MIALIAALYAGWAFALPLVALGAFFAFFFRDPERLSPDETHVVVSPWPFGVESVNLEVPGRAIPVGRYVRRDDLAAAPAQPLLLRWQLLERLAKS